MSILQYEKYFLQIKLKETLEVKKAHELTVINPKFDAYFLHSLHGQLLACTLQYLS